jgi:hypothetical protein
MRMAAGKTDCKLKFSLAGWSAFYKTASGDGHDHLRQRPEDGRCTSSPRAAGLTFGKSKIDNGTGEFSGVNDIKELLGSYAQAEAHAGARSPPAPPR